MPLPRASCLLLCCACCFDLIGWSLLPLLLSSSVKPVSLAPTKTPPGLLSARETDSLSKQQITTAQHGSVCRHNLNVWCWDFCDYRPFKVSTTWYACPTLAHMGVCRVHYWVPLKCHTQHNTIAGWGLILSTYSRHVITLTFIYLHVLLLTFSFLHVLSLIFEIVQHSSVTR